MFQFQSGQKVIKIIFQGWTKATHINFELKKKEARKCYNFPNISFKLIFHEGNRFFLSFLKDKIGQNDMNWTVIFRSQFDKNKKNLWQIFQAKIKE